MKRRSLLQVLGLLAFLVWGWAVSRLIFPFLEPHRSTVIDELPPKGMVWVRKDSLVRDPFSDLRVLIAAQKEVKITRIKKDNVYEPDFFLDPPKLVALLGGAPPMAILDSLGKTRYALEGEIVFGWKVLKISTAGAVMVKRNRHVVLR